MRSHRTSHPRSRSTSILSFSTISLLFLGLISPSSAFDCKEVVASKTKFNFKELGGPRIVHWEEEPDLNHEVQYKYNFTLDICSNIPRHKGVPKEQQCHTGTRICAIREEHNLAGSGNGTVSIQPIEIAGTYTTSAGPHRKIDERVELLRESKSHSDTEREGVRVELHGGRFPFDGAIKGREQQAIIEFVCDKERTGLEGSEKDTGEPESDDGKDNEKDDKKDEGKGDKKSERLRRRDDDKSDDKDAKSLRFVSYKAEKGAKDIEVQTLRLEWRTKHACEDAPEDNESSHWGFFTWFLVIFFLATATYLIFGSWLNYNRYGARGWDLLPHGDTIRDIPYILKDCARRVKDSMQGSGSRGGYAAV